MTLHWAIPDKYTIELEVKDEIQYPPKVHDKKRQVKAMIRRQMHEPFVN
jgi:hypothetical protein